MPTVRRSLPWLPCSSLLFSRPLAYWAWSSITKDKGRSSHSQYCIKFIYLFFGVIGKFYEFALDNMQKHIFINSSWVNMVNCSKNVWILLHNDFVVPTLLQKRKWSVEKTFYEFVIWMNELMDVCIIPIFNAKLSISYLK